MTAAWPGWTRHGHRIEGVPSTLARSPVPVARCGGPHMCSSCARDAAEQRADSAPRPPGVGHELTARPWRVGRKTSRVLYAQLGDEPSDVDALIGTMDSPLLAEHVVDAHNASLGGAGSAT